jgi:K+-transporting ATPase ATPase A chain
MTVQAWFTLGLFVVVLVAIAYPLAIYVARIADPAAIGGPVGKFERILYRASGVDSEKEMPWTQYAIALLLFNALGVVVVFAVQRLQLWLPFNPQAFANVSPDSSFNSAVSFVTNTNWYRSRFRFNSWLRAALGAGNR